MMEVAVVNPWSGELVRRYAYMDDAEVDRRLAGSAAGFAAWSRYPLAERAEALRALGRVLRQRRQALAAMMTAEMGKRVVEGLGEVDKCAGLCDYYAEHAGSMLAPKPLHTDGRWSELRYEPIGCVFAVMPWNFPIWQVFRFLAPTLMLGNVAVLKHAINVPGCADTIADAVTAAGLPTGVFTALHIDNAMAARVIADPRVHGVTLTGSERAGRAVAAEAGRHLKKCVMELGGSDPFIVLSDADIDTAVATALTARYDNAGQTCIAAKRFILEAPIAEAFTERFLAGVAAMVVGDPADPACTLAPMARPDLRDGLHAQVQASVARGARLLAGGIAPAHPCSYPATVLDRVPAGSAAYCEELFGPVASLFTAADAAAAIALANDTRFGLGASLWTADLTRAAALADRIEAGSVFINARVRSDYAMPFGGSKQSGHGRELGEPGLHEFANLKSVYVAR
jgi:succinate-semialdehyde dehydrogenase/glutarate-semialdehyde dehydrogenase